MYLIRCAQCGHASPFREGMRFCVGCAASLAKPCGGCGRDALVGDRFCAFCGQALASGAVPGVPGAHAPAPAALGPEAGEFLMLAERLRQQAQEAAGREAPLLKDHLDQADLDRLFQ